MSITTPADSPRLRGFLRRPLGVFVTVFLLAFIPMCLWNLASPLSSSPDEPAHFVRAAAVVRGEVFTGPLPGDRTVSEAEVPAYVAWTQRGTCYAFKPDTTANCVPPMPTDPGKIVVSGHTAAANSPGFYAVVGLPSLFLTGAKGLYAMRGMNSVMCAAMIGFIFMALSQFARPRWSYLAAFVAVTPMVLYLGGTLNPNGIEAVSAAAIFTGLTVLTTRMVSGARLAGILAGVVAATFFLVGTRSISLLWALLAVGLALVFGRWPVIKRRLRQPWVWVALATCAALCVVALWFFLRPSVLAPAKAFLGAGSTFNDGLTYMLQHTFEFGSGWIGFFGWVDTPAPAFALVAWGSAMVAIVATAFLVARGRKLVGMIILLLAFVLVPAVSQAMVITTAGFIWQGRYTLALVLMLMIGAGVVLDRSGFGAPNRLLARAATLTVWVLAFCHVYTFFVAVKRYVVGETAFIKTMFLAPQWQPPLGWLPLTATLAVVTVVAAVVVTRSLAAIDRRWSATDAPTPRSRSLTEAG